jgi:hypothetical protein
MKNTISTIAHIGFLFFMAFVLSCTPANKRGQTETYEKGTFGYDLDFLSKYQQTILLQDGDAMVAVCPAYQGRVMTSSAGGKAGMSYGWINYTLISSGEITKHIYPVGGEDRFWLGPEGGQFSIYFQPEAAFTFEEWQTPPPIDTEPFDLVSSDSRSAVFEKDFKLKNYKGAEFEIKVNRKISLLGQEEIRKLIRMEDGLSYVAYQSVNAITNIGENPWTKDSGALSIWILGMFTPSERTTIMVPYKQGSEAELGPIVNDSYFGKVPSDRLIVDDGLIFFRGDGKYRSKIGLSPARAIPYMGSYDADNNVLTIVFFTKPEVVTDYVNSLWEIQDNPFAGDVSNSYNDGPVDGTAMGPFYELESSSPAAFLNPGASMTHVHKTIHITGHEAELDKITLNLFKVKLESIKGIF